MVFYDIRILFGCDGKFDFTFVWITFMFLFLSSACSEINPKTWRRKKKWSPVFTISSSGRNVDHRYCRASFTVEATFVTGIVIVCLAGVIGLAYKTYDTVTGAMILEEVVQKARICSEEKSEEYFENQGEFVGNPRLWLGEYQVEIDVGEYTVSGKASAGDWKQEIEIPVFRPGGFLRQYEALRELGKESGNDGSGVQTGDESELHGGGTESGT